MAAAQKRDMYLSDRGELLLPISQDMILAVCEK